MRGDKFAALSLRGDSPSNPFGDPGAGRDPRMAGRPLGLADGGGGGPVPLALPGLLVAVRFCLEVGDARPSIPTSASTEVAADAIAIF